MNLKLSQSSHSIEKWLEEFISQYPEGTQLPYSKTLAEKFQISESTVHRKIGNWVQAGKIIRVAGKGTFLASSSSNFKSSQWISSSEQSDLLPLTSSIEKVKESILDAISKGIFKQGNVLPSIKTLCHQSHVSTDSMRIALNDLYKKGVLSRLGRSYTVGGLNSSLRNANRNKVILLTSKKEDALYFKEKDLGKVIAAMEGELLDAGCFLEMHTYADVPQLKVEWKKDSLLPRGIVLAGPNLGSSPPNKLLKAWQMISVLFNKASYSPKMIGLLRGRMTRKAGLAVYNTGHFVVANARETAKFVVIKGVKRVHFLYNANALPIEEFINMVMILPELMGLNKKIEFAYYIHSSKDDLKDFQKKLLNRFKQRYLQSILSKHASLALSVLFDNMHLITNLNEVSFPKQRTLWISYQDAEAVALKRRFLELGMDIPNNASIITLENGVDALRENITACESDHRTIGYCLAHTILGDIPIRKTKHGYIPASARIIERRTTPTLS